MREASRRVTMVGLRSTAVACLRLCAMLEPSAVSRRDRDRKPRSWPMRVSWSMVRALTKRVSLRSGRRYEHEREEGAMRVL